MAKTEEKNDLRRKDTSKALLRDEIAGLREINGILTSMIYFLLCGKGEIEIPKKTLSEGIGKYVCEVGQNQGNYTVRMRLNESAEVANEGDEI